MTIRVNPSGTRGARVGADSAREAHLARKGAPLNIIEDIQHRAVGLAALRPRRFMRQPHAAAGPSSFGGANEVLNRDDVCSYQHEGQKSRPSWLT